MLPQSIGIGMMPAACVPSDKIRSARTENADLDGISKSALLPGANLS